LNPGQIAPTLGAMNIAAIKKEVAVNFMVRLRKLYLVQYYAIDLGVAERACE